MKNVQKGISMEINPLLKTAAIAVVREQDMSTAKEIPQFSGIFVAHAVDDTIDVMHGFVEEDVQYVVGPRKK